MLTLTRRSGEGIVIGSDIEIVVLGVSRGRVRIGIRAPRSVAVHRSEVVAKIEAENRKAVASVSPAREQAVQDAAIVFEAGLFGLSDKKRFVMCDVGESDACKALVSTEDQSFHLFVVDAVQVWPDYPVRAAREAAGIDDDEIAVAAIATVPADGSQPTANLMAPLVIGLTSRRGAQVILDRAELGLAHPLVCDAPKRELTVPT